MTVSKPASSPDSYRRSTAPRHVGRRLLLVLVAFVTLVALGYTIENWRGKRAWEACKREIESRGVVMDWQWVIPRPVPESENIFQAPGMAEFVRGARGSPRGPATNSLAWRLQNPGPDRVGDPAAEITTADDAREYLKWSDSFAPDFARLERALERPYAWIPGDYSNPATIPLPDFVALRVVAQTLAQRAQAQLLLDRPEEALADLKRLHDLRRLVPASRPAFLVKSMIHAHVTELHTSAVAAGLRTQTWREPQLATFERQLGEVDLISTALEGLRSEQALLPQLVEGLSRRELGQLFGPGPTSSFRERWLSPEWLLVRFAPRGWLYRNMVWHVQTLQRSSDTVDLENQIVHPLESDARLREITTEIGELAPNTFLAFMVTPNFPRALETVTHYQTRVNQARVVCALERYHAAHGQYPEILAALTTQFPESVPHDLVGGQPLRYDRSFDGGFRLYSIGWNERDDGGRTLQAPGQRHPLDWVWE
jgi:hypothetical protein